MSTTLVPARTGFLLTDFTKHVANVTHAIAVSVDGLLLSRSEELPHDRADQLAAIAAGIASLAQGAATFMEAGAVRQNILEMGGGLLFLMSVRDTGYLLVLASRQADVGQVGYEMARLVEQVGNIIKPGHRAAAPAAA